MSTTINIIPVETCEITYGQIIQIGERNINRFLTSLGIQEKIKLSVNLQDNEETRTNSVDLNSKFELKENEYAWFYIDGIPGGTDGYQKNIEDKEIDIENPWWMFDEMEMNNKTIKNIEDKFEKAKKINKYWYFRRSAGQPGIIALSYGLISAGVAELTDGILWADDGAWDFKRFPADSSDFLRWYFRQDMALERETRDWAKRCIEGIIGDLKNYNV